MSETDTLVSRFEQIVERYPERTAVSVGGQQTSYRELNGLANQLAHTLLERLGRTPQPVAFLLEHSLHSIVAILGTLKAGKFYVPLDPTLPPGRIQQVLEDAQIPLLITNNAHLSQAQASQGDALRSEILNLDEEPGHPLFQNPSLPLAPEDYAYLLYTSGSTGKPKGVIHAHRDTLHNTEIQTADLGLTCDDRLGLFISFGFEAARFCLYGALLNGATLSLLDIHSAGVHELTGWIQREQITVFLATPSAFRNMFLTAPQNLRLESVRLMILGGEPVTSHEVHLFQRHFPPDSVLNNTLGSSETGVIARYLLPNSSPFEGKTLPAGYPPGERQIIIVDENGQPLPPGEVGEIWMKSRFLSPGYWRQPELTAARFTPDPTDPTWRIYHTGDLGRLQPDGCLEYLGRKDSQVKIRGYRVEVAEIEAVLLQHPEIKDAAVTVHASQRSPDGKRLVAFLVPRGEPPRRKELREYLQKTLPNYMVPADFVFMEDLPHTPSGKVDLRSLIAPDETAREQEEAYLAPRDELEAQLVKLWERVLKIQPIGVQDNYFELGGNSLLAAQLFSQIEKTFGRKLPLASLFQAATVAQQAELLRQSEYQPTWSSLVLLRSGGSRPPLFFAAPVGGNVLSYHDLLRLLDPDIPCYGLQAVGLDGVQKPKQNLRELAAHYIQEMRSVQPHGPYYLAGSSFGGLVAYEMAQQLHDLGEKVAMVVMIDSYGPNYPHRLPSTSRLKRRFFKIVNRLETHLSNLAITDWPGRWNYVRLKSTRLMRRVSNRLSSKVDQWLHPLPRELRQVRSAQAGSARKHRRRQREMRRFGGRLILFRASKQPRGIYPDPLLGWGAVVGEDIEVYEIPGHHTSIIYEPRVHRLATILNQILQAEDQAAEAPANARSFSRTAEPAM